MSEDTLKVAQARCVNLASLLDAEKKTTATLSARQEGAQVKIADLESMVLANRNRRLPGYIGPEACCSCHILSPCEYCLEQPEREAAINDEKRIVQLESELDDAQARVRELESANGVLEDADCTAIVGQYLDRHGYDGLFNWQKTCACEVDDLGLGPCDDGVQGNCEPGYKGPCDDDCALDGDCDWHIASARSSEGEEG